MHKPKVRFQFKGPRKPRIRASTQIRKAAGLKKPFKASAATKKSLRS
jgi:hypothetical protein